MHISGFHLSVMDENKHHNCVMGIKVYANCLFEKTSTAIWQSLTITLPTLSEKHHYFELAQLAVCNQYCNWSSNLPIKQIQL